MSRILDHSTPKLPWAGPVVAAAIGSATMLGSYVTVAGTIMLLSTLLH
jgi:hypothetical protein